MKVTILSTVFVAAAQAAVVEDLLTSAAQYFDEWAASISDWNSGVGYDSAMVMQLSDYDPLSVRVSQLSESVLSMPTPDPTGYKLLFSSLGNLTSSVTKALSQLNEKSADYHAVGAQQVIGADISELSGDLNGIVNHIVDYMPANPGCDTVSPLASAVDGMASAFDQAATTYNASMAQLTSLSASNCTSVAATTKKKAESGANLVAPSLALMLLLALV